MSIAIVSRFMNIDLPYQSQWFEYYIHLGISHFYLYYVDRTFLDIEHIVHHYPTNKISLKKIDLNLIQDSNNLFFDDPFQIKEDYILHIDSDEYLYLNNQRLSDFIKIHPNIDAFYFYWYMCPSPKLYLYNMNEVLQDTFAKKYIIKMYKVLAKNKNIAFLPGNTHDFHFVNYQPIKKYMENPYFLIHFSYRGICDSYYKYIYQDLPNHRDKILAEKKMNILQPSITSIFMNELPSRVAVYLAEISNRNPHIQLNITLPIREKSQINLYDLFHKGEKEKEEFDLYCKRMDQLSKQNLYRNLFLQDRNVKTYIRNQTSYIRTLLIFTS